MRSNSRPRLPTEGDFLALVELIYEAAADGGVWPRVLERLSASLHTAFASITVQDLRDHRGSVEWLFGLDPSFAETYVHHFADKNIFLAAAAPLLQTGAVLIGEEHVADRIAMQSEFFNDFLRPIGVLHHTVGCIYRDGTVSAILNLPRPIGTPSFTASEVAFCRRLMPHFQRAVAIHRKLQAADIERTASDAALDRLPFGVVLIDERAKPIRMNRAAHEIFEAGDGLTLAFHGMSAARPADAAHLRLQIRAALDPTTPSPANAILQVARPSQRRAYAILVAPLRLRTFGLTSPAANALVFIHDPERQVDTWEDLLHRLYGFTLSECHIATLLLRGLRVEDVAEQLAISMNTARTHLKHIFAKTGSRSQSDLLRILLTGPAQLRSGDATASNAR